jgi:membrane protease YdiL (CAAX protease family)
MAALLWSAVVAFLILFVGQTIWGLLLAGNFKNSTRSAPWSVAVMAMVLWLFWQYLGGKWPPRSNSETRKRYLRANAVSRSEFALSFVAGVLAVIALAGYWIVFFQLVKTPPNVLDNPSKYPVLTIVLVVAMSSLVSPIVEEIAFRGYCQQILEDRFSGQMAVFLSSLLFMLAHANHGWYWPKLSVYFLAGVTFGTLALLTNSILTSLPVHILGDLMFFILIWPHDGARALVGAGGADNWFWLHAGQAIVFTVLSLIAFRRLSKLRALAPVHQAALAQS